MVPIHQPLRVHSNTRRIRCESISEDTNPILVHRSYIAIPNLVLPIINLKHSIRVAVLRIRHPGIQPLHRHPENSPRQMMPAGILGVDENARAGVGYVLVTIRDRTVAVGSDVHVDEGDAGIQRRGVRGAGLQRRLDGSEEDVGVGAGDAVEVLGCRLACRRGRARGLCVFGVDVA